MPNLRSFGLAGMHATKREIPRLWNVVLSSGPEGSRTASPTTRVQLRARSVERACHLHAQPERRDRLLQRMFPVGQACEAGL
jgi:hypothetical protein